MNRTKIEWVKNPDGTQGYTWNPITGCLNHNNGLCKGGGFPCYAYKLANGRLKQRYLANTILPLISHKRISLTDPFYPRFWEERLRDIERPPYPFSSWSNNNESRTKPIEFLPVNRHAKRKAVGIFPCDMGDLFGIGVPEEWTTRILEKIRVNSVDRFYLLTKQAARLPEFSPFPENAWVGVTATNTKMFVDAMDSLYNVQAKVKYLSLEPLLEWHIEPDVLYGDLKAQQLDWIIIGAQTNPYKPPLKIWVDEITEAAKKAGIPYFLKDNLRPLLGDNLVQEMP